MMDISVNDRLCILSQDKECRNCVAVCPRHVLAIREHRVAIPHPERCISCHCCKGSCPAGLEVIKVERSVFPGKESVGEPKVPWEGLKVRVGKLTLTTPLILASGPVGRCTEGWLAARESGFGAVVTKTTTPLPWPGNPAIRVLPYGKESLLNCEGLPNLGMTAVAEEVRKAKELAGNLILIPSITAMSKEEFTEMARLLQDAGADGLEIALMGCPNYRPGTTISQGYWIEDPRRAFDLVNMLRKSVQIPLWIKGAQNGELALACEDAGADALLVRSGSLRAMPLDPVTGAPILSHPRGEGSLTGSYTKLPGIKVVMEMSSRVKIPIIGNGGVFTGQDVIDYMRAGAHAVELLTVVIRRGMGVVERILSDLDSILKTQGYRSVEEVRRQSLKYLR